MDNSVQRSKSNLSHHIKLNVNEPNFLICIIILTIISPMFLYFSPYLYLACLYTPTASWFNIWINVTRIAQMQLFLTL